MQPRRRIKFAEPLLFTCPRPAGGSTTVAQGQAAAAAALGKTPTHPNPHFSHSGLARRRAKPEWEK